VLSTPLTDVDIYSDVGGLHVDGTNEEDVMDITGIEKLCDELEIGTGSVSRIG
jgi:hypothetical protein